MNEGGAEGLTVREALAMGVRTLSEAGCEQPRLDAEVLLAGVLGVGRAHLYAHTERRLTPAEEAAWQEGLSRRARREPLAYVTGQREFYGLDFLVDSRVLVPRPETELIVDRVLALASQRQVRRVWDVGTGSGALALTLAYHLPGVEVIAGDLSEGALEVAAQNRRRLRLEERVQLVHSDLLAGFPGAADVVVANLPYLRSEEYRQAMPEVSQYEPALALDAGPGGLEVVARLLAQAKALDPQPGVILLEIGAGQGPEALALARKHMPTRPVALYRDLAGLDRVLEIQSDCAFYLQVIGAGGEPPSPVGPWSAPPWRHTTRPQGRGDGGEVPTHILPAGDADCIAVAAEALRRGDAVAFPTDTVYGLGATILRPDAVQALYEIKGRPEVKAIPLLLANPADLAQVAASIPPAAARLAARFWPGPLTLVLEARPGIPAAVLAGGRTVAARVPDHPVARALIDAAGTPLATTSANRSGAPEALTAVEVVAQLGARVRWVIDGGRSPGGTPSTVLDLTVQPPVIRRVGALPPEALLPLAG